MLYKLPQSDYLVRWQVGAVMSESRVAIVTGGADGIGKATSELLLMNGYRVVAFDIAEEKLKSCDSEFSGKGTFLSYVTDVTDEESVNKSVGDVLQHFGRIDVLVNNAGGSMAISQSVELIDVADWDKVIRLNLRSVFLCTKAVVPIMKKQKYGRIISMSSMAGRGRSYFGGTPYATAKAGILGFTRQSSKDLGPYNITINAVAPGIILSGERIKTYWNTKKSQEERDGAIGATSVKRMGESEDVARTVLFLADENSSYITGAVIDVNGGIWVG